MEGVKYKMDNSVSVTGDSTSTWSPAWPTVLPDIREVLNLVVKNDWHNFLVVYHSWEAYVS